MNEQLITLASKLILASTSDDQMTVDTISNELSAALTQKGKGEYSSPFDFYSDNVGFLKFTNQEILKMPKSFRKTFRTNGCTVHYRERKDNRYKKSYEARYAKKPYNNPPISVSAPTIEKLKERFIEKINYYVPQENIAPKIPTTFDGFATYWFENFHKQKVGEKTYKKNLDTYKRDILKEFEHIKLKNIIPVQIQQFLEKYSDKERTKETLHSILNQIFVCAVKHGIIKLNPLDMCFYKKHERKHGKAISKAEEKLLLSAYIDTTFLLDFVIPLYTGLRPNEYKTATIEGNFIKAVNSKRKHGKTEFKRIPITPMLKPYLEDVADLKLHHPATITEKFKQVLPNHTLYDMRTTFQTRCTECGITEVAIGLFMGNAIGGELKKAYTDVSDEWLVKESEKFNY